MRESHRIVEAKVQFRKDRCIQRGEDRGMRGTQEQLWNSLVSGQTRVLSI